MHIYLKKEYWPDVKDRDPLEDMSEKLTDHKKARNFYNVSPALSPDGSMVAVLSDENGYFDIHILDAMTGKRIKKLVKGNRSVDFEELKWLQPGLSWSPDNKSIVFAAKAGKGDVLHVIDVETKKSQKYEIDIDGVFSAAWSPKGNEIAFVGQSGKSSDIYLFDLKSKSIKKITDDIFSDAYPSWNSDGTEIAFVSDRGEHVSGQFQGSMYRHDYSQTDIYKVNVQSRIIERITDTEYNETHPVFANTANSLFYTADHNGVWNLFSHPLGNKDSSSINISKNKPHSVTNVLTGLQQPTLSGNDDVLIFAGYSGIGWDLYSIAEPLKLKKRSVEPTQFILNKGGETEALVDLRRHKSNPITGSGQQNDYSDWIFANGYQHFNSSMNDESSSEELISIDSSKVDGEYVSKDYKTRFTLDLVSGNLQISNVFGTSGMTYFAFSDILGDHQIAFGTEMVLTLDNSDYFFQYGYLKNRMDYYFIAFQNANFFNVDYFSFARLRHYGLQGIVSQPFSRFQRLDYGFAWHNINYSILEQTMMNDFGQYEYSTVYSSTYSTVLPKISWVYDNSIFGFTGPIDGLRQNTTMTVSPGYGSNKLKFQTVKSDIRKYWRFGRDYTVALRGFIGKSFGPNKQKFFLGGIPYLLSGGGETNGIPDNSNFREVITDTANATLIHDVYFTEYAWPLRGARFAERYGNTTSLFNIEVRFPFINYLALGFPLKMIFGNIRGHAFVDIGAAWDSPSEFSSKDWPKRYGQNVSGNYSPWVSTAGLGTKINLGYFLLKIEMAWDRNSNGYSKPQWYFSLGPDW